jgi:F-type H+-transporting ATPase subunit epsilon
MREYRLKIVTPEKIFFDDMVEQVIVRTSEGDIGILAGHENYVADLASAPVKIKQNGKTRVSALSNGMIKVSENGVIILATAIEWAEDIDIEWAKRSEQDARNKIQQHESDRAFKNAELKLKRALNRISVHNSYNK